MTKKNTADDRHARQAREDRVGRRIAVEEAIRRAKDHSGLWHVDHEPQEQETASGTRRKANTA